MRPFASVLLALLLALSFSGCDPREWLVCATGYCGYALDDVAPHKPQVVTATPGDRQITLAWKPNEDENLFGYEVYRSTAIDGEYTPRGFSFEARYDESALENGTTYFYYVVAKDGAGNASDRSLVVSATPQPPPRPLLPAPTVSVEVFVSSSLKVSWTSVAGASRYRLFRTAGSEYELIDETSTRFYFDDDVEPGTVYRYVVAAVDSDGREGERSAEASGSIYHNPGPTLALLRTWGERGQQQGRLWDPRGIAADRAGNVYVTDNPAPPEVARVQRFSPTGALLDDWGLGGTAHGVAVDSEGAVYVVNGQFNRVLKYTADGTFLTQWGSNGTGTGSFRSPTAIAIDADDNVYVADTGNARIQRFTAAGTFVREWPVGAGAAGVATDAAGDVYVVDRLAHRVQKFTRDGAPIHAWGTQGTGDSEFEGPQGIGVDSADRLFVADTGNDRLQTFSLDGVLAHKFGSSGSSIFQFDGPNAIANDCHANLFVLDAGNSRVSVFGDPASAPGACPPALAHAAAQRPGFRATMTTTASTGGKVARQGNRVLERGATARGTFSGRLVGRAPRSTRAFAAFSRGTWRARFDISVDPRTLTGTAKGVALATPRRSRAGRLCLGFDLKVAVKGTKVTLRGTFKTLGGSGAARTLNAGGTFEQTLGKGATYTLRGTGVPGRRSGGRLPRACRLG